MRIAVASSDGVHVNLHLGKANSLYIYEYSEDQGIAFYTHREVEIDEDGKHQGSKVLEACSDCDVIICVKYGFKTKIKAEDLGIKLVMDECPINEALEKYIEHYNFMNS